MGDCVIIVPYIDLAWQAINFVFDGWLYHLFLFFFRYAILE